MSQRTPARIVCQAHGKTVDLEIYGRIGDPWNDGTGISAKKVADALKAAGPNVEQINLRLNSPGGMAWEGLTIYNLLTQHAAKVIVTIDGMAASAASVIAMAGDEVRLAQNGMLMIHNAMTVTIGNSVDHNKQIAMLDRMDQNLAEIYATRAKGVPQTFLDFMAKETYFTAQEAVANGLATSILRNKAVAADFDASQFTKLPDWAKPLFNSLSTPEPTMSVAADPAAATQPAAPINATLPTAPVAPAAVPPAAAPPAVVQAPTLADVESAKAAAQTVERTRVREIMALCDKANLSSHAKTYIDEGLSIPDVQAKLLTAMCNASQPLGEDGKPRESSSGAADPDAAFKAEYAAQKATINEMDITEEQYVKSRRISAGLDKLTPIKPAAK